MECWLKIHGSGQIFLVLSLGAGTLALGYNHPDQSSSFKNQRDSGPLHTKRLILRHSFKRLHFIQSVKNFLPARAWRKLLVIRFCGPSGADAVEAAIKLAKQTTGRNAMFAFQLTYHGMTNGYCGGHDG